jgi:RimJ/RimL family protein N-acetyltransferase
LKVLETDRLVLRWLGAEDAAFILQLINEPSWLRYIGDKGVRTLADAAHYIRNGPVAMYHRLGFGLYLVALRDSGESLGICGLIKRDSLDDVDLGFAFLPIFCGKGYACEAVAATTIYGKIVLGLARIVAIVSPDNHRSGKLLEKVGFRFEHMAAVGANGQKLKLYACVT